MTVTTVRTVVAADQRRVGFALFGLAAVTCRGRSALLTGPPGQPRLACRWFPSCR
jgi:hypothetical protein